MDGHVMLFNPKNGKAMARTKGGEYTIFQVLGDLTVKSGDLISGKLHESGQTKVVNLTQRRMMSVIVQATNNLVAHRAKQMVFES